jgi:hypothetical protein
MGSQNVKLKWMISLSQGRIKKIMQTDEEVGKVAQAVPVIIYILSIWEFNILSLS